MQTLWLLQILLSHDGYMALQVTIDFRMNCLSKLPSLILGRCNLNKYKRYSHTKKAAKALLYWSLLLSNA